MTPYSLFTDASVDPGLKAGVGGYLLLPESFMKAASSRIKTASLDELLVLQRFEATSSTRLEVQTVLWALEEYSRRPALSGPGKLRLYTDSQCVAGLLSRRNRLEKTGYRSRGGERLLKNASLYKEYYKLHDRLQFEVVKVAGHTRYSSRQYRERIFSFVDKKVRKALKLWVKELKAEKARWYVYMIRCRGGALYTGISNDVARRFEKHREAGKGGAKYLRGRSPLELVFQKKAGDQSAALKMERQIKKLPKSEKEAIIKKGNID